MEQNSKELLTKQNMESVNRGLHVAELAIYTVYGKCHEKQDAKLQDFLERGANTEGHDIYRGLQHTIYSIL